MPETAAARAPRCQGPGRAKGSRCTEPAVYLIGEAPEVAVCAGHLPWGVREVRQSASSTQETQ